MNFHERFGGISRGGGNSHMTGLLVRDFEKKSYEVPARRFCRCGLIFFHSVEVPILKQDINWHWLFLHPILWKVKAKAISGGPLRLNILRITKVTFLKVRRAPPRAIFHRVPLREKKIVSSLFLFELSLWSICFWSRGPFQFVTENQMESTSKNWVGNLARGSDKLMKEGWFPLSDLPCCFAPLNLW